jgi:lysophospholipase L1-like esterase
MTRTTTVGIAIVAIIAAVCSTVSAVDLGNIMPLGDSITRGSADPPILGGYRQRLYNDLTNAGYGFTPVGTQTDNASAALTTAGQAHHEGHGSYTIAGIDQNLDTYLAGVPAPNYVLLMIGTNDFVGGTGESTAINRLDTLIGHITSRLPDAHLIVADLTVRRETQEESHIQTLFNPFVPDLVSAHAANGEKVSFVDMHSVLTVSDLGIGDNCHPNQVGYNTLGDAWFDAIQAVPEPSAIALLTVAGGCGLGYAGQRSLRSRVKK